MLIIGRQDTISGGGFPMSAIAYPKAFVFLTTHLECMRTRFVPTTARGDLAAISSAVLCACCSKAASSAKHCVTRPTCRASSPLMTRAVRDNSDATPTVQSADLYLQIRWCSQICWCSQTVHISHCFKRRCAQQTHTLSNNCRQPLKSAHISNNGNVHLLQMHILMDMQAPATEAGQSKEASHM